MIILKYVLLAFYIVISAGYFLTGRANEGFYWLCCAGSMAAITFGTVGH